MGTIDSTRQPPLRDLVGYRSVMRQVARFALSAARPCERLIGAASCFALPSVTPTRGLADVSLPTIAKRGDRGKKVSLFPVLYYGHNKVVALWRPCCVRLEPAPGRCGVSPRKCLTRLLFTFANCIPHSPIYHLTEVAGMPCSSLMRVIVVRGAGPCRAS